MEAGSFLPPTGSETEILKIPNLQGPQSTILSLRPLVGATLRNLGNTCFMNAVLQCMTHTVPLVEKLRSNNHRPTCSDNDDEFCSFCTLREHVDKCIMMPGSVISPRCFAYNINKISSYFEPGEQQDAHEFLCYFLDSIDKCFLKHSLKDQYSSSLDRDSPVNQVFRGRLKSQLQCSDCGHCSDTYEHLLDLSLEIDDAESLTNALESFTRKENIDDLDAKFTCDGCKAQVSMEKQLKIDQPPAVIALHLKRFKNNGLFTHKICKFVNYPLELDLRPYMSCPGEDEQSIYDLYASVVHDGSCYSGHYYCNIRTSLTTWHQMNDSLKGEISESTALHQEAYILFYIKKGSYPWFTSIMDVERVSQLDRCGSPSSVLDHEDSDLASSSGGEASCSTSWQILEMDEDPSPRASTSLVLSADDEQRKDNPASACTSSVFSPDLLREKYQSNAIFKKSSTDELQSDNPASHSRSPDCLSNNGVFAISTLTGKHLSQSTKQPASYHNILNVFTDEPSEDDKENLLIPQNHVCSKGGSKEAENHNINAVSDAQLLPFRRLVKRMPSSRRSSILACLNNSTESSNKQLLTSKSSNRPSKRRQGMFSGLHSSGGNGRHHCASTEAKGISPRSLKRGFFAADQDQLNEF